MEPPVHQHPKDSGVSKGYGGVNHLSGLDRYQWNNDVGDEVMNEGVVLV